MEARDHQANAAGNPAPRDSAGASRAGLQALPESAVQAALERKPQVQPSSEFARRVALLATAQPQPRPFRTGSYARLTAMVAVVVVACALFALAPRGQASFGNFVFDLELAILAQLALLVWWLGTQHGRPR